MIPNVQGFWYSVSSINDCSYVTWLFLLKEKANVPCIFELDYQVLEGEHCRMELS